FTTLRPPRLAPLFPYTTLFRSHAALPHAVPADVYAVMPLVVLLAAAAAGVALFAILSRTGTYPADRDRVPDVDQVYTRALPFAADRKSTRLNSSHVKISYAVFC